MVKAEEVTKIAKLAKLEFSETELSDLTGELNHILGYIDQLSELDVRGVAPLENMNEDVEQPVFRKDEVRPSLAVADALKNAPKAADNYFLVPKVLEQEKKAYIAEDIVGDEEEELM